ncbi:DUF692 family multinuclear iron-containing protein [Hymenobacter sp. NBH84]|uniref:chryseobasin-related MNIO class RiPP peptide n=1 Tax=Hymenobacter sp. NBH84 TaxID=2596915 RepID=UPI002156464F|nr:DUF692 family multinuclear iron-containing protein [Hymenobacter sp. NBH84]
MKLSKALLGAVLVGITAQTTACTKGDEPAPKGEKVAKGSEKKNARLLPRVWPGLSNAPETMAAVPALPSILSAIACNLDDHLLAAALPLLEAGQVEAVEWSFDTLFDGRQLPNWFAELLTAYGEQGRLIGHGVYFSLLSGRWTPEQAQWLEQLRLLAARFHFDHITEHFGSFTGQNFHTGAPLPVPYTAAILRLGQDRLLRIADACQCPVGLENLAFAYSLEEVQRHGEFLEKLLAPVNGFLILDLHNLYCQLHNFDLSTDSLLALYPLHRVRGNPHFGRQLGRFAGGAG